MKFSYTWLRELVPGLKMDVTTLAQQITMKTAECEGVHDPGAFAGASVAAVASAENSEPDSIIEIDNKSLTNRPDLWGHLGMAREVAAIAGLSVADPVGDLPAAASKGDLSIALQLEDHFFVGADNGLFGLISDKAHQNLIALNSITTISTTFPERDIFAPAAVKLASGISLSDLGKPLQVFKKMIDRQVKATKKQITGSVVRVDGFGNLITNIPREAFDILSKEKVYTVQFGGEKFRRIHSDYHQVDEGECVILFNSLNMLEIGIYKGNASDLLGLAYDSVVTITFDE